jgi:hypothetical protein
MESGWNIMTVVYVEMGQVGLLLAAAGYGKR